MNNIIYILIELKNKVLQSRIFILVLFYICLVFVLLFRLFKLQLIDGEYYQQNYIQKSEKTIKLDATRGNIYDVNGELLAYNKLSYSVNIQDNGSYKNYNDKNYMLYNLVKILNNYDEQVVGEFEVTLDKRGNYIFSSQTKNARLRFLRDVYGLHSINELDTKEIYKSDISAEDLVNKKVKAYKLNQIKDKNGNIINLTKKELLDLVNIRYSMSFNDYHKYDSTKVAINIKEKTKAAILENAANLLGVSVDTESIRVYNDSIYFSSILGYTGKITESQLEDLQSIDPEYTINDIVGRTGIEESMEAYLKGIKGHRIIHVDNVGHILLVKENVESKAGSNIYLTIDKNLQIGMYHLLEQELAGILLNKIVDSDNPNDANVNSTDRKIPVKSAYFQLINNNVLDATQFEKEDAKATEKEIYDLFKSYKKQSIDNIDKLVLSNNNQVVANMDEDLKTFTNYIYSKIIKSGMILDVATSNQKYIDDNNKFNDGNLSIKSFIYDCLDEDLIDLNILKTEKKYIYADEIYELIHDYVINSIDNDEDFNKLLYKNLINNNVISGKMLMLCLYEQNVLPYDEQAINLLNQNGENYAYSLFMDKIRRIELTPAQLALDPCTAGAVITDIHTGKIKALVSYPGYDNNKLSNNMDVSYFNKLINDQSLPLYNTATQARKAPGSTYKPLSAVAALEEGVITTDETINCTGRYEVIKPFIKCWIYPGKHGPLNTVGAIQNSCNYYFAEVGHRLSIDKDGNYDSDLGIKRLKKYAQLFGLDEKSGVELSEIEPIISEERPEQSTFGQGMNAFANVQLARYTSALANKGDVYKLSLIDTIEDNSGKKTKKDPILQRHIEVKDTTWNAVREGMHKVVTDGSASKIFKGLDVEVAGKTGTAQESKNRANHAFFISFAPYNNPSIALTVNIPYGYSSANAVATAKQIYKLYFGYTDLDTVLKSGAYDMSNVKIGD